MTTIKSIRVLRQVLPEIFRVNSMVSSEQPDFGITDELMHPRQPMIEDLFISSNNSVVDVHTRQIYKTWTTVGVDHGATGDIFIYEILSVLFCLRANHHLCKSSLRFRPPLRVDPILRLNRNQDLKKFGRSSAGPGPI